MAESRESMLLSESRGLDMNENISNSQNNSFSNTEPLADIISTVCLETDSAYNETSNTPSISVDCVKPSEFFSETPLNNSDITHINDEFVNNSKADSGIHDSDNNIIESEKLIELNDIEQNLGNKCDVIISDFIHGENDNDFKDEEFHDAVQFFKDPSSLTFLENAGMSSAPSESLMARSSLYQKFDPLHAKFFSQATNKSNDLKKISEDEIEPENDNPENVFTSVNLLSEIETQNNCNTTDFIQLVPNESHDDTHTDNSLPDIIKNKHIANLSPRQSLGNILISFDSPVISKEADSCAENKTESVQPKIYTEEELHQRLKIQELTIQETFLKKQQELEENFLKNKQELETNVDRQKCLSNSLYAVLKEAVDLVYDLSSKERQLTEKLEIAEKENVKLKEDLKTSVEDIQSVETTFSDFHKRYEQCKNMLKVYTENEKSLKQQLENMNTQLHEKEEMYKALQSRTQEMLDKANTEVANAKKTGDAQVAVLKAQLKKAELKISSLESDVKHVKIENGKLSSICDELMAKVSES